MLDKLDNIQVKVDLAISNETLIRLAVTAVVVATIIILTLNISHQIKK